MVNDPLVFRVIEVLRYKLLMICMTSTNEMFRESFTANIIQSGLELFTNSFLTKVFAYEFY